MNITDALLTPFECSECHSQKCTVEPILPAYTETHEVGLFITCAECDTDIATLALTPECGAMLLDAEADTLKEELKTNIN